MSKRAAANDFYDPEPRWPAAVAIVAVAGLYYSLPEHPIVGPRWAFPALVLLLLIPLIEVLFRYVVAERIGTIILSALIAHTGWHWMLERLDRLRQYHFF